MDLIEACWHQAPATRPAVDEVFIRFEAKVVPAVKTLGDVAMGAGKMGCEPSSAAAAAEPAAAPILTLSGATMGGMLLSLGMSKFEAAFTEHGFADIETLSDRELCDDATLIKKIGMTKMEIRKLRNTIESLGTGPTMMMERNKDGAAANGGKDGKVPSARLNVKSENEPGTSI